MEDDFYEDDVEAGIETYKTLLEMAGDKGKREGDDALYLSEGIWVLPNGEFID